MHSSPVLSRMMVLAAAVLFSTGGTAIKSCSLTDWQIAGFRCGVAALTLFLLVPQTRRHWTFRVVAVGCVYAATLICYSLANKATTSANAIFLQSSAPLYILLLAPWLLMERSRKRDILLLLPMAAGLVLCVTGGQPASATAPEPGVGNLYGALAGFFWALTVLGLRWLSASAESSEADAVRAVAAGNVLAFSGALPMALPVVRSTPEDWAWVAYLGIFQIAVAYLLLTRGLKQVTAFEASILLLAEPIFNPIWAWWIHSETPTATILLGGTLILTAATAKTWMDANLVSELRTTRATKI